MFTFFIVLIILVSVLLVLVVLMQNKGQGMAGGISSGANQIFGASRSTDIIEKATWILAGTLVVLAVGSSAFTPSSTPATEQSDSPAIENASPLSTPQPASSQEASPFNNQTPATQSNTDSSLTK